MRSRRPRMLQETASPEDSRLSAKDVILTADEYANALPTYLPTYLLIPPQVAVQVEKPKRPEGEAHWASKYDQEP